jgi:hypothetical protein
MAAKRKPSRPSPSAPLPRAVTDPTAATGSRRSGKRELIDTGTDKRYVRRNAKGQFKESDDVGRSLAQDIKRHAKTVVRSGQGDKGDQKRKLAKKSKAKDSTAKKR